jgi:cytochrome c-type biogenesis protein CcmH/NrfF
VNTTLKRWGPWALLGVIVVVVLAVAAWPSSGHQTVEERARSLESELRCVDCEALSIAESSTPSAAALRADVEARLRDGQSDAQIRQAWWRREPRLAATSADEQIVQRAREREA